MKYNAKSKIDQIQNLESSQKAKAFIHATSTASNSKDTEDSLRDRKNFTFYLSESLLSQIETFLDEFGERKETKSAFIEDSVRHYLAYRKAHIQQQLEEKLARLKKDNEI